MYSTRIVALSVAVLFVLSSGDYPTLAIAEPSNSTAGTGLLARVGLEGLPDDSLEVSERRIAAGKESSSYGLATFDGRVFVRDSNALYALDQVTGEEMWRFVTGNVSHFSPRPIDGVIYAITAEGEVSALDSETSSSIWQVEIGFGYTYPIPVVANDLVYVGADNGVVHALDETTGEELWRRDTGDKSLALLAAGDMLYATSWGTLHALDAITGKVRWRHDHLSFVMADLVLADGQLLIAGDDGTIRAIASATGTESWVLDLSVFGANQPVVVDEMVYAGGGDSVLALDLASGEQSWKFQGQESSLRAILLGPGTVIAADLSGMIYSLDISNGREKWRFQAASNVKSPIAVTDQHVFVACDATTFCALDLATGQIRWQASDVVIPPIGGITTWTEESAEIAGGTVFLAAGQIYALDEETGAELWRIAPEDA